MKERPILFSAPMVRAILEGRKWQTRRVIKNMPPQLAAKCFPVIKCPFGKPSDRLWVRETWQSLAVHEHLSPANIPIGSDIQYPATYDGRASKHRPSIHMPRWASRITLEIINIRIERLQDISEKDAMAEGAQYFPDIPVIGNHYHIPRWSMKNPKNTAHCLLSARMAFANFINECHGGKNWNLKPRSLWDDNPYVWAIEFKRIKEA